MTPTVTCVALSSAHTFSKADRSHITLLAGLGVEGDAHCGVTVKHRSRVKQDPTQPNLRQVHLIQIELFEELAAQGFTVIAAQMGENVTTRGLDLLALPTGTELALGADARVRLTGLRNPCPQLDNFQPGLMAALLGHAADGSLIRKAGVMAVVLVGGRVAPGDAITVNLPGLPHHALERV